MITLILTLLKEHWQGAVLALVIAFAAVQSMRLKSTQKDLAGLQAKVEVANKIAEEYQETTEKNLDTLQQAIPVMVTQASNNAVANYKKRYGNIACGVRTNGLLPSSGTTTANPTNRPESSDVPSGEFISACARDAARLNLWVEWATLNQLPVSR